jgi:hypothetical protein
VNVATSKHVAEAVEATALFYVSGYPQHEKLEAPAVGAP